MSKDRGGRGEDVHRFGITDFEEIDGLRLDLHHLSLGESSSPDPDRVSLVQSQLIHDLLLSRQFALDASRMGLGLTHCGRLTVPSSAMNSRTPTCVLRSGRAGLVISNVTGNSMSS